ncbi:DEAD/DEAH box helicase family protein [Psittacicella hinzii]|uniref:Helicase ATP-binding domain-containing protein n=1 Tax=Psittacicella hinzii TaxID=2028575 RepID=A0A3A1YT72_9GAMM|nr:DEAD/DEAH box helicase family protein [Psittacicella hinzii]RIY39237.1 hypothetical protein CKF58_02585 [Psittacicella hinzii]
MSRKTTSTKSNLARSNQVTNLDDTAFLYKELDIERKYIKQVTAQQPENEQEEIIPLVIKQNLNPRIDLREYQEEALENFILYYEKYHATKKLHTLFHMATGSGKTVIMASLIIYLYSKGYRNFIFFVNQVNILEKTLANFTNASFSKFLFVPEIEIAGRKVKVNVVDNFSATNLDEINLCFTTVQKLSIDLKDTKENSISLQDFSDNKVVFISDESHHINTYTKNKLSAEEKTNLNSWEIFVTKAFNAHKDSIMLEFTATCDLKHPAILDKYRDKIVYNYPLKNFRESGYTKEFKNYSTRTDLWTRSLIALILSEYRRFLFADQQLHVKPVVLFKSQKRINESEEFYAEFINKVNTLSVEQIETLYNQVNLQNSQAKSNQLDLNKDTSSHDDLVRALTYFYQKDFALLVNAIKEQFNTTNCIIVNSKDYSSASKMEQLNSLEDRENPIRAIFTVDMLNEGWDVLNLFDIVRLYDPRQGGRPEVSSYTIKEAQLIGRGARYCPFVLNEDQDKFKRKFDDDIDNPLRILETMYFHCKDDSKYIQELRQALIAIGLAESKAIEYTYTLKPQFKDSVVFDRAVVYTNEKVRVGRESFTSISPKIRNHSYRYAASSLFVSSSNLFEQLNKASTVKDLEDIATRQNEVHDALVMQDLHIDLGGSEVNLPVNNFVSLGNEEALTTLYSTTKDDQASFKANAQALNSKIKRETTIIKLKDVDYRILLHASEFFNGMNFAFVQKQYPHAKSLREFLTADNYLGNITLEIVHDAQLGITNDDLIKAVKNIYQQIEKHLFSIKPTYIGTTEFKPIALCKVIQDGKTIKLTHIPETGSGKGVSQITCEDESLQLDLSQEDWYVFNDNYGTSEEKAFVKYFKQEIAQRLRAKGLEFYVIRNERFAQLALYSFSHGERFEPDFLLLVKNNKENELYSTSRYSQVFIEPKGQHLFAQDGWKQEFLSQLKSQAKISENVNVYDNYQIIGMPFFNKLELDAFDSAINKWLDEL